MEREAYETLRTRVDTFFRDVETRRQNDLQCRSGCTSCCHVELTLSPLEASVLGEFLSTMEPEARNALRLRARSREESANEADAPCVMLEEDGRCAVYAARPLVCRSQGLALSYPSEAETPKDPEAAPDTQEPPEKAARTLPIYHCGLNFRDAPPEGRDILNGERIDTIHATLNQHWCATQGRDPLDRTAIRTLAANDDLDTRA